MTVFLPLHFSSSCGFLPCLPLAGPDLFRRPFLLFFSTSRYFLENRNRLTVFFVHLLSVSGCARFLFFRGLPPVYFSPSPDAANHQFSMFYLFLSYSFARYRVFFLGYVPTPGQLMECFFNFFSVILKACFGGHLSYWLFDPLMGQAVAFYSPLFIGWLAD